MSLPRINAPWTPEQVEALNLYQQIGITHPFTCAGYDGCERHKRTDEGILIASADGWVCPCGKWKQTWAHAYMAEPFTLKDRADGMRLVLAELQKAQADEDRRASDHGTKETGSEEAHDNENT